MIAAPFAPAYTYRGFEIVPDSEFDPDTGFRYRHRMLPGHDGWSHSFELAKAEIDGLVEAGVLDRFAEYPLAAHNREVA